MCWSCCAGLGPFSTGQPCWHRLSQNGRVCLQMTARKVYILLDTILSFCLAATIALSGSSQKVASVAGGPDASGTNSVATARVAAHKGMALAKQFKDSVLDLVVVLSSHEMQRGSGSAGSKLLEVLNFNGFYNNDLD
jgi:hypothetical protein